MKESFFHENINEIAGRHNLLCETDLHLVWYSIIDYFYCPLYMNMILFIGMIKKVHSPAQYINIRVFIRTNRDIGILLYLINQLNWGYFPNQAYQSTICKMLSLWNRNWLFICCNRLFRSVIAQWLAHESIFKRVEFY